MLARDLIRHEPGSLVIEDATLDVSAGGTVNLRVKLGAVPGSNVVVAASETSGCLRDSSVRSGVKQEPGAHRVRIGKIRERIGLVAQRCREILQAMAILPIASPQFRDGALRDCIKACYNRRHGHHRNRHAPNNILGLVSLNSRKAQRRQSSLPPPRYRPPWRLLMLPRARTLARYRRPGGPTWAFQLGAGFFLRSFAPAVFLHRPLGVLDDRLARLELTALLEIEEAERRQRILMRLHHEAGGRHRVGSQGGAQSRFARVWRSMAAEAALDYLAAQDAARRTEEARDKAYARRLGGIANRRRRVAWRLENGLCPKCGRARRADDPEFKHCRICRQAFREYQRHVNANLTEPQRLARNERARRGAACLAIRARTSAP